MIATYLCVGGPLDGQHRTMPPDTLSFHMAILAPALHRGGAVEGVIEYQLVWSEDHGRLIWRCAS